VVPQFVVDELRTVRHSLGFVPGVWIPNLQKQEDSHDGLATYEGEHLLAMIHECNMAMSQASRATRHACDPQWVNEIPPNADGSFPDAPDLPTMKKGGVWQIPGVVKLIEAAGSGQKSAHEQFDRTRSLIANTSGWPEVEATGISDKAQSAEALRVLFQGAIAFASQLRVSYGDNGLVPLCRVILRVLKATAGDLINVDAFGWDGKPVKRTDIPDRPRVKLQWGEWFPPTANDQQAAIASTSLAVSSELLSQEAGVSRIAPLYGRDGAQELKKVQAEREARVSEVMREQQDLQDDLDGIEDDEPEE
jgi:hypothetical protein